MTILAFKLKVPLGMKSLTFGFAINDDYYDRLAATSSSRHTFKQKINFFIKLKYYWERENVWIEAHKIVTVPYTRSMCSIQDAITVPYLK